MELDPIIVAKLPTEDLQALLQIAARLAPLGVAIELKRSRSAMAKAAGQASAQARRERFGTAQPPNAPEHRSNTEQTRTESNEPERRSNAEHPRTTPNKAERSSNEMGGVGGGSLSLISDLRSEDPERERAREARAERKPKRAKAPTWRRVPEGWQPSDQHRQIASECCVPFELELAKFRDHEFSTPKHDPDATFRNWLRNARPAKSPPFPALPAPPKANGHHATKAEIDRMLGLA